MRKIFVVMSMLALVGGFSRPTNAQSVESQVGGVTVLSAGADGADPDYINAKGMPAPMSYSAPDQLSALLSAPPDWRPAVNLGRTGDGVTSAVRLGMPAINLDEDSVGPQEFGTSNHPFSSARADLFNHPTNTFYPYAPAGKLFFNIGTSSFVCSASLIKRGVIVTAAHCVAQFGASKFHSNWRFAPGYRNGAAPFGVWTAQRVVLLTAYFNGTDSCAVAGVVCRDDVAVIVLRPSATGAFPGTSTGFYGYGWNGFGFAGTLTHITQLGYPVCLDNGAMMERNDSHGFVSAPNSNNTIIGSLMCGGSSGGPWIVNHGIRPALTGQVNGTAPNSNVVVGVTSWGYTSNLIKQQGASPFTSGNIVPIVNAACGAVPAACS